MSTRARQFICEKHGPYILWEDLETGSLSRSAHGFDGVGYGDKCPKCKFESQKKILAIAFAIILFLFVGLPKIIYGKFGKKGVIIYFACWLSAIISFIAVREYNIYKVQVQIEQHQAEERSRKMKEDMERQGEELRAKMRESQERMKQTKAKKEEEERIVAKWQKIEEGWSATSEREYNLKGAIKYCSSRGWRLANNKDWEALAKYLKAEPKLYDKFAIQGGGYWWSSTKLDDHEGYAYAWTITGSGFYSDSRPEYETFYVRCIKK